MIIIDKPFVSKFLIDTIKQNNFPLVATPNAKELIEDDSLNWMTEKDARNRYRGNPQTPIYTNSENSISWIENNFTDSKLPSQIDTFKNKIKFRELLKDNYPNYFFKGVKFEELENLNLGDIKFPIIVKPAVGFFSIAVHKVERLSDWKNTVKTIQNEVRIYKDLYPMEVINTSEFIIEEYFEGEEYAIDCYFNSDGKPVILNILHHVFSSNNDVSDRIYSTSKSIFEKHYNSILEFLKIIQSKTNLKNFPAHIEVRIDSSETINPIEVNPLRFGGWCTTGDLSWFAYGFNSYEYFIKSKVPNWSEIFKTRMDKKYSIVVLDNNSGTIGAEISSFDYDKLSNDFTKILDLRKADFRKFPVFGFLFIETKSEEEYEITNILKSNLKKYITVEKQQ